MKMGLTELVFILDRSGSMNGLERDTIGGFNSMLEKQKRELGEAVVTTVLFDDKYELIHDHIEIEGIPLITKEQYYVRGMTALLDAVGQTIVKIDRIQKSKTERTRAEKVIFVIVTDGMENSSTEFTREQIKEMIEEKQKSGIWEFIFLGANMDAVKEAGSFGVRKDRAVTYCNDSKGVRLNYKVVSEALCKMRCCEGEVGDDWMEEIEEDVKMRGSRE